MTDGNEANIPAKMNKDGSHTKFCQCERCKEREEGYFGFFKNMTLPERVYYTTRTLAWTEERLHSLCDEMQALRMDLVTLGDALE